MNRLFFAIPLPDSTQEKIAEVISKFPQSDNLRLESFEKLHLTLAFIGKVSEQKQKILISLLSEIDKQQPCSLELIPELLKSTSVIALKIKNSPELDALVVSLNHKLHEAKFSLEHKPYVAHVTFGRFKKITPMDKRKQIKAEIKKSLPKTLFSFDANQLTLYQSTLTRSGSVYTSIAHENFSN